jgi:hypothetical protein
VIKIIIKCSWCGKTIGEKKGRGVTHGMCKECEGIYEAELQELEKEMEVKEDEN